MRWASLERIREKVAIPEGLVLDQVSRTEITELTSRLREWYPDIQTGMESPFLDPDFFLNSVTLKETARERSVFALVMRDNGQISAFYSGKMPQTLEVAARASGMVNTTWKYSTGNNSACRCSSQRARASPRA